MITYRTKRQDYSYGFKRGLPVALGYLPVSFTFGSLAVQGGLPIWLAIFISFSNLTSAGQFAGTNLIITGGGYFEIMLTTFVINLRYMLMSFSISQKLDQEITLIQRLIFGFAITDETFVVASSEPGKLSNPYMLGLITGPIGGWTIGTALGALICSALPDTFKNAMGIALYAMFIAIIIPATKKTNSILVIVFVTVIISCILKYLPILRSISFGFRVIIATTLGAGIGAVIFPIPEERSPR